MTFKLFHVRGSIVAQTWRDCFTSVAHTFHSSATSVSRLCNECATLVRRLCHRCGTTKKSEIFLYFSKVSCYLSDIFFSVADLLLCTAAAGAPFGRLCRCRAAMIFLNCKISVFCRIVQIIRKKHADGLHKLPKTRNFAHKTTHQGL